MARTLRNPANRNPIYHNIRGVIHAIQNPCSMLLDGAVLTLLLIVVNVYFSPHDLGWTGLNPSPWFLVPVLVGCRHGAMGGAVWGALTSIGIVAIRCGLFHASLQHFLESRCYFFLALPGAGALCGEIASFFIFRVSQLSITNEHVTGRLNKLGTELYLMREAKDELARLLAARDTEVTTLDFEMRRLYKSEGDELYPHLLRLLARQARVTDAAIYRVSSKSDLERLAFLGNEKGLPLTLRKREVEMISLAIERKTVVSIPEIWEKMEETHHDYLVALPFLNFTGDVFAMLVITGIPFMALNRRTIHVIALICRWASEVVEANDQQKGNYRLAGYAGGQKIFSLEFFKQSVELAFETWHQFRLHSCLVLFSIPQASPQAQKEMETMITSGLRTGDVPVQMDFDFPNLAVLVVLTGQHGGEMFLKRMTAHCKHYGGIGLQVQCRLLNFEHYDTIDDLWRSFLSAKTSPDGASGGVQK